MLTGTDYNTRFLSLRPNDNTRSIAELLDIESSEGYSGMSDEEIANLIEYKQHEAKNSEELKIKRKESEERINELKRETDRSIEESKKMFDSVINNAPIFKKVEGV